MRCFWKINIIEDISLLEIFTLLHNLNRFIINSNYFILLLSHISTTPKISIHIYFSIQRLIFWQVSWSIFSAMRFRCFNSVSLLEGHVLVLSFRCWGWMSEEPSISCVDMMWDDLLGASVKMYYCLFILLYIVFIISHWKSLDQGGEHINSLNKKTVMFVLHFVKAILTGEWMHPAK